MKALVLGAGGFIGTHLVKSLKLRGYTVVGADLNLPHWGKTHADEFYRVDLRNKYAVEKLVTPDTHEVYQLAADMGGAGYISTGEHDAEIMTNNSTINLNVIRAITENHVRRVFFASSACVYPERLQVDPNVAMAEDQAYPAEPDSAYGWEKLYAERLYLAHGKNHGIDVKIARFHAVFGPYGTWEGGREKSVAALCRKIITSENGEIEVWGDGTATRSFLYIDEAIEGVARLMNSDVSTPLNIGSNRSIAMNELAHIIARLAGKTITIRNIPGPLGVSHRNSDNTLIQSHLRWQPADTLETGLLQTYRWIESEIGKQNGQTQA